MLLPKGTIFINTNNFEGCVFKTLEEDRKNIVDLYCEFLQNCKVNVRGGEWNGTWLKGDRLYIRKDDINPIDKNDIISLKIKQLEERHAFYLKNKRLKNA